MLYIEEQSRNRFQSELEFIQCLANPNYLNFLAQRGYLREKPFVNYLKYLLYWKEPDYAKFLKYPHCLHMLELLQYEHFRKELVNAQCAKFIDEQQLLHWQHYSRKRTRLQQALAEQQPTQQQQQPPPHGNAVTNLKNGTRNKSDVVAAQQGREAGLPPEQGRLSAPWRPVVRMAATWTMMVPVERQGCRDT
ncbi:Mediator of RNA polymerase II transcription subunit 31 [Merluccius polli]|uniref:Mediator of RNA polymerase II transcription subunit 31 n=1 Tax=Merluccius polli TaxID=89951 RepID=A0AA47NSF3_MERPO|nr:Mediator of RNA polymerase II transcription subunit 31 [Merluccius polli]